MKIGKYEIGRYHAIVKTGYSDGTFSYSTFFRSRKDLYNFISNHRKSLLDVIFFNDSGSAATMISISIIYGKDKILAELVENPEPDADAELVENSEPDAGSVLVEYSELVSAHTKVIEYIDRVFKKLIFLSRGVDT